MKFRTIMNYLAVFGLVVSVSLPVCANERLNSNLNNDNSGRFKIFIAEHNIVFKTKNIVIKSIFKMDRDTGIVWRYRQGVDSKGKTYEEFFEVPNQ